MEFENQSAIKKQFKTFKDAFKSLPEDVQKHSIRVAEYTKTMFVEAIAIEMRMGTAEVEKLQTEFMRGAYLSGLYHDIGKAWLPEEYHHPREDFGEEETAMYRKHVTYGAEMAEELPLGETLEAAEIQMIKNSLHWHHLRPDGLGFPGEKKEEEIPMLALIVGMANHLDHLVTSRRSEDPFNEVMDKVLSDFPEETDLQFLVEESRSKLQRVFLKFQDQSQMITPVAPFAKRKVNRSFELQYRPVMERRRKATVGIQARPCFKDNKETYVEYDEVKTILNKNKLHAEVGRYFLYEAADTLRRIKACELDIEYIAVQLMPKYYTESGIATAMQQVYADARLSAGSLYFALEETMFENPSKALMANLERISKAELPMFLNNWSGEYLKAKELVNYSFKKVALHPSVYKKLNDTEVVDSIKLLQEAGVEVIAGELDKIKYNGTLNGLEITAMTGVMAGDYISEDEMIRGELAVRVVDTSAHI